MTGFSVILLAIHYTIGTFFLPADNFLYLSQLSDIDRRYEIVNRKTDLLTFAEENFLEFENKLGLENDGEPFGNEEQQIQFKPISINGNPALPHANEIEAKPQILACEKNSFPLIKKYTTEIVPIFIRPNIHLFDRQVRFLLTIKGY